MLDIIVLSSFDQPGERHRSARLTIRARGAAGTDEAADAFDIQDGVDLEDLQNLHQRLADIIFANFLTMLVCCVCVLRLSAFTCIIYMYIYVEKKYMCIGGEKIHILVDQQHQLTADVIEIVGVTLSCIRGLRATSRKVSRRPCTGLGRFLRYISGQSSMGR